MFPRPRYSSPPAVGVIEDKITEGEEIPDEASPVPLKNLPRRFVFLGDELSVDSSHNYMLKRLPLSRHSSQHPSLLRLPGLLKQSPPSLKIHLSHPVRRRPPATKDSRRLEEEEPLSPDQRHRTLRLESTKISPTASTNVRYVRTRLVVRQKFGPVGHAGPCFTLDV
jgi:hypothetical protein